MYYKDESGAPFLNPPARVIKAKSLTEIDKNEFDALVTSVNTPTAAQLAEKAQRWARSELEWVDLQLKYSASGDTERSKFTNNTLYAYAIKCRDYVQSIDGVLTIVTDKPARPSSED